MGRRLEEVLRPGAPRVLVRLGHPVRVAVPGVREQRVFVPGVQRSHRRQLGQLPQGPAANDKIWLYMLTWHMGLFACMMFGQIGVQARKHVTSTKFVSARGDGITIKTT